VAVFAPQIAPYDPNQQEILNALAPPSLAHPLGTDHVGRDVLSRIIVGSRISLSVGLLVVVVSGVVGVLLGLAAGYYESWPDAVISRIIDVLMAFPSFLLALAVLTVLGPSLTNAMIAVAIAQIPTFTRVMRGTVLSEKQKDYVLAARVIGAGNPRIMLRHLPINTAAPIIVLATLNVAGAILTTAALSFLGLGAQPPTPEWGAMLSRGRSFMRTAWWLTVFPGLAIMVTVFALNLLGDGLRDILDPRLRNR
jgi:peptide/nickel transport system permease protein